MQDLDIRLEYTHEWIDHPLIFLFYIDNRIIHLDNSGKNNCIISKKIKLADGKHLLKVQIQNKNEANTIIDQKQRILSDSFLRIDSIRFDDIEIKDQVFLNTEIGKFYIDNQSNNILTRTSEFGYNGCLKIEFSMPMYNWLLESYFGS